MGRKRNSGFEIQIVMTKTWLLEKNEQFFFKLRKPYIFKKVHSI